MDNPVAAAVAELRADYTQILLAVQDSSAMTKGGMLSKALCGLFDHVYKEYAAAMDCVSTLDVPKSWRKIDVIREAGALQVIFYWCQLLIGYL